MSQAKKAHHTGNGKNGNGSALMTKQAPAELPTIFHHRTMYEKFVRHLVGSAHGSPASEVLPQILPEHQAAMRRLMNGTEQLWQSFVEETKTKV